MNTMFETAARKHFRFETSKGSLAVEDLFELPLTSSTGKANLDDLAKTLYRQIKAQDEIVSFVDTERTQNTDLQTKFDIVKYIIDQRVAENAAARAASAIRDQKQRLMEMIEKKKGDALAGASLEELQEMLKNLG